jgi:hypothetical protein
MKQELEIKHTRHIDFYHGSVKPVMLAYSMLWCSKGKGLQPTLLKWSNDQLEATYLPYTFPFARISTTLSLLQSYTVWWQVQL